MHSHKDPVQPKIEGNKVNAPLYLEKKKDVLLLCPKVRDVLFQLTHGRRRCKYTPVQERRAGRRLSREPARRRQETEIRVLKRSMRLHSMRRFRQAAGIRARLMELGCSHFRHWGTGTCESLLIDSVI